MNRCLMLTIAACALAATSEAHATEYFTNYTPAQLGGGEINASIGGLNARSLVAGGRMDLKFWSNTSISEDSLLSLCKSKSPVSTTWKEGCDFGGLTAALSSTSGNWVKGVYMAQTDGLNAVISGLRNYHSPAMVPLYGHATHWGSIYMVDADGPTIYGLEWYDSGPQGQKDGQYSTYQDGVQGCDGETFNNLFYKVLNSSYLGTSDPYLGRFLATYEPPKGMSAREAEQRIQRMAAPKLWRSPGILRPEERMTPEVAQERVWDALFAANVQNSENIWPKIEGGWADLGWEVHGVTPAGESWDYFLVPVRADDGVVLGLIQLSAHDGAYQQIWAGFKPIEFVGLAPKDAAQIAQNEVGEGGNIYGGELTWAPDVEDPLVPSPLFPYYEFHGFAKDKSYTGRILVTLRDGRIIHPDVKVSMKR